MSLTRRDLIKAGVFAGAALSLPLSRVVSGQSALGNRMPASKLPKPFTTPFVRPPVAVPVRSDDTTDYYAMHMLPTYSEIVPGYQTLMFGYEGSVPGPTIKVNQGRKAVVRHCNTLPTSHPTYGYEPWTSVHLHGSASLPQYDGYASDITHPHSSRTTSIRTSSRRARSGTTTTGSITRPRTCGTASSGSTTCSMRWSSRCRSRTASTTCR